MRKDGEFSRLLHRVIATAIRRVREKQVELKPAFYEWESLNLEADLRPALSVPTDLA
jgi:hypothetical protein